MSIFSSFINIFVQTFYRYKLIISSIIFFIPFAINLFNDYRLFHSKLYFYNILLSYLILFMFLSIQGKLGIITRLLLSLLFFINLSSSLVYDGILGIGAFSSLIETGQVEALNFLRQFGILNFLISALISFLFIFSTIKSSANYFKKEMLFVSFVFVLIFPFLFFDLSDDKNFSSRFKESPVQALGLLYRGSIFHPISLTFRYLEEVSVINQPEITKLPENINLGITSVYDSVYLILGESASKNHYSFYGYEYPTSPLLDLKKKNPNLIWLDDAISVSPITRYSHKKILTLSKSNSSLKKNYMSIITAAKLKGFDTSWLSSHPQHGLTNFMTSKIARSSNKFIFDSNDDYIFEQIIKDLDSDKKNFTILHLFGSHFKYENYFEQDFKHMNVLGSKTSEYDATIMKTDKLLNDLIEMISLSDKKILLVYLSDHGEVVGHGHGLSMSSKDQYKVPFFIYDTTEEAKHSKFFFDSFNFDRNKVFNTQFTADFIFYSLGYEYKYIDKKDAHKVLDAYGELKEYNLMQDLYFNESRPK